LPTGNSAQEILLRASSIILTCFVSLTMLLHWAETPPAARVGVSQQYLETLKAEPLANAQYLCPKFSAVAVRCVCVAERGAGPNLHLQTSEARRAFVLQRERMFVAARGPKTAKPTNQPTDQTNTVALGAAHSHLVFCVRSSRARLNYLLTRRVPRHSNSRLLGIIFAGAGKAITTPPNVSEDIFYAPREETRGADS
jgi:hypothetical protein